MKKSISAISALTVALLAGTAWSTVSAQERAAMPPAGGHMMEGMPMSGDMMGMKDMMGACNRMMQGGMTGHMLPQLPPGNEKLQLQMHAEMLQKMGEIVARYADQIKSAQ